MNYIKYYLSKKALQVFRQSILTLFVPALDLRSSVIWQQFQTSFIISSLTEQLQDLAERFTHAAALLL